MKELQEQIGAWSTESPTEPGWYRWRVDEFDLHPSMAEVRFWGNKPRAWLYVNQKVSPMTGLWGQWAGPLVQPEDSPKPALQAQWVPLSELRPGAIFETRGKVRAVKTENFIRVVEQTQCILLDDGSEFFYGNGALVREIVI